MDESLTTVLGQLQEVELAATASWWPPAVGWWLLAALSLLLLAGAAFWRWQRFAVRRQALRELAMIHEDFLRHRDHPRLAMELNLLLKRVALASAAHAQPAGLTGSAWLRFLDANGGGGAFASGAGAVLAQGPYRRSLRCDAPALRQLAERWIRVNT